MGIAKGRAFSAKRSVGHFRVGRMPSVNASYAVHFLSGTSDSESAGCRLSTHLMLHIFDFIFQGHELLTRKKLTFRVHGVIQVQLKSRQPNTTHLVLHIFELISVQP